MEREDLRAGQGARPAGSYPFVYDVSCASADSCAAVGSSGAPVAGPVNSSFAELWNGAVWSVVSVPGPKGFGTGVYGVSCGSATSCVAVGEGGGAGGTLSSAAALTGFWNGKSWRLVTAS